MSGVAACKGNGGYKRCCTNRGDFPGSRFFLDGRKELPADDKATHKTKKAGCTMFTSRYDHFFIRFFVGFHEHHHLIWFELLTLVVKAGHLFFYDGDGIGHLLSLDGAEDTKDACKREEGFHGYAFEVLEYVLVD